MRSVHSWLSASLIGLAGCAAYNPDCPPDETGIIGQTETVLDLRRSFVRTGEAPIGNLITDAFYDYLLSQGAQLALVNAGSIRDRTECRATEFIDRGPIRLGQLVEVLPFENKLALVEVTGVELLNVLEHSVSRLGDPGEAGLAGRFLQVSHLRFQVDCAKPPQEGTQVGQRISNVEIRLPAGSYVPRVDTETYLIATNTFLAEGGDAFSWLRNQRALPEEKPDFVVVANYISAQTGRSVAPTVDGRIQLHESCLAELP